MIHARTAWVGGTAACFDCRLDRVHSEGAVSAFFRGSLSESESGVEPARRVPRQPRRHMDTALRAKHEKHRAGWTRQAAIFVVCVCRYVR